MEIPSVCIESIALENMERERRRSSRKRKATDSEEGAGEGRWFRRLERQQLKKARTSEVEQWIASQTPKPKAPIYGLGVGQLS